MWKCSKCKHIISEAKGSIHVTDGYCPKCKEYFVMERYDPLNEEKESPL